MAARRWEGEKLHLDELPAFAVHEVQGGQGMQLHPCLRVVLCIGHWSGLQAARADRPLRNHRSMQRLGSKTIDMRVSGKW